MIDKALASDADAVVLDLEDAVPTDRKQAARRAAATVIAEHPPKPLYVRINPLHGPLAAEDVAAIAAAVTEQRDPSPGGTDRAPEPSTSHQARRAHQPAVARAGLVGVRVPKTERPEDVVQMGRWLTDGGCRAGIVPLIETALGVDQASAIARAHPAVLTLAMGEADLQADLGATADVVLDHARVCCVVAARAARRAPPIQSVHTALRDDEGLRATSAHGRALGFGGRSAIHPAQVPVINAIFTPTDEERAWAAAVVAAFEAALARGETTAVHDGRFIDEPVARHAAAVLALAHLAAS
jgi:citrate lyase subunit beta/citryl-CoA lyase